MLLDQQDPENRITELEYQLAERTHHAELPSARPDDAAVSRRFVASPPFFGSKWNPKRGMWLGYAAIALFVVPMWIIGLQAESHSAIYQIVSVAGRPLFGLFTLLVLVGFAAAYWRHSHRKILIDVTSDGMTVSTRPGEVFPFRDAQLGPWSFWQSMGSALHLHCGPHRFVLGGRDHRLTSGIVAPPTKDVDAWLWAADFNELLAIAGRRGGSDEPGPEPGQPEVRGPAPGGPIRCALFPNPEMISVQPVWAPWRVTRMANSFLEPKHPSLAIDVGPDTIRVVDPTTNAVQASARLTQVTATPEFFLLLRPSIFLWPLRFFPYGYLKTLQWTTPVLVVGVPGMEPLSISCRDDSGKDHLFVLTQVVVNRFSWHFKVSMRINRPADWSISAADWLTLVETFGLTQSLEDKTNQGRR